MGRQKNYHKANKNKLEISHYDSKPKPVRKFLNGQFFIRSSPEYSLLGSLDYFYGNLFIGTLSQS
jgi:hypothetical protein